jgi:predicted permease
MRPLLARLLASFRRRQLDEELSDEISAHLEFATADNVARGMSLEEARRAAGHRFGGPLQTTEAYRDRQGFALLDSIAQDVRYAVRTLRRSPGFTATAVLSLTLGIGANTAIFSLIDAVMWRTLPIRDPAGLWLIGGESSTYRDTWNGSTYQQFQTMNDNQVADIAAYAPVRLNVRLDGRLEPTAEGQLVSGKYFSLLGVNPVAGRAITPDDDRVPNGHPVAVISDGYWTRRFGRAPSTLGRTISLSGTPFTIIGVTPPGFYGVDVGTAPDVFVPVMMQPAVMPATENLLEHPIIYWPFLRTLGRLKPGINARQAADALWGPYLRATPQPLQSGRFAVPKLVLTPAAAGRSALRRQFSQPLFVLMAAVSLVLLIACANTANLFLARAAARGREFAMRSALGAGCWRLVRQLLAESIVLAGMGGLGGVLLAGWATRLLVRYMSEGGAPIVLNLNPDLRVLAFTAAMSVATGIVFGLVPAMRATRLDLASSLKRLGGTLTTISGAMGPGRMLAILQVALSLVLLITAGLFMRSLQNIDRQDSGFARDRVLVVRVEPKGSDQRHLPGTSQRLDLTYRALLQRVEAIPGVRSASLAGSTPTTPADLPAELKLPSGDLVRGSELMVYPHYFDTLGMSMMAGRDFRDGDLSEHSALVCVVNETFARRAYTRENAIGKPCLIEPWRQADGRWMSQRWEIIGVVKDSQYARLRGDSQPTVYTTFFQTASGRGQMVLHVRTIRDATPVLARIRQEVLSVDQTLPQFEIHTLATEVDVALIQERLLATLSNVFGIVGLVLACVGLYGLMAFSVVQRNGEIGIRMALGAARIDVLWMVLREALLLTVVGVVIGVSTTLAMGRLASGTIAGLLFGLRASDPGTIVAAAALLVLVAGMAAYVPARRASRVDPLVALRNE